MVGSVSNKLYMKKRKRKSSSYSHFRFLAIGKHGDNYGSKPVPVLSWEQRVKIATGAAKGLEYIHKKKQVHRNIRSSNVLLFDDCEVAKLGDFGRSTHYTDSPSAVHQRGYHPPEYVL